MHKSIVLYPSTEVELGRLNQNCEIKKRAHN